MIVYLCSFYRTSRFGGQAGFLGKLINVIRARLFARVFWQHGVAAICPVANTALFDYPPFRVSDEALLSGLLALASRADALVVIEEDWERSPGIREEVATACDKPVYFIRSLADARRLAYLLSL